MRTAPILLTACLLAAARGGNRSQHAGVDAIGLTVDSAVCADDRPFLLFITVLSHVGDRAERGRIRDAYPVDEIAVLGVRRVFVLGTLRGGQEPNAKFMAVSDEEVSAEAALEKDVIQFDFVEDTNKLSVKSYLGFRWALQRCGRAAFVAKADDDTFLEYYSISKYLSGVPSDERDAIRGELYWFPVRTYFMVGGFYVMPTPALRRLVAEAGPLKHTHGDDVLFTGKLADKVGLRRQDVTAIRPWTSGATCCMVADDRGFACDRFVFLLDARSWRRQAAAFKAHGRRCFVADCERYSPVVKNATGVRCIGR